MERVTHGTAAPCARRVLLTALLALLSAPLAAERPDIAVRIGDLKVRPGGGRFVVVEMSLGERWHVNSHTPSEDFLVPTDVTLRTAAGERLSVRYPQGEARRFSFSEKPLSVYAGTVLFEADLPAPDGGRGPLALSGEVSFQACTDEQCFPPARISLSRTIEFR